MRDALDAQKGIKRSSTYGGNSYKPVYAQPDRGMSAQAPYSSRT